MRRRRPAIPVGATVRCYRPAPDGRVGVVRETRYLSATEYRVEWTDGKTPPGASTWVRAVNISEHLTPSDSPAIM